MGGHPHCGPNE
jgi:hypothetical protein